jgi:hypothetical protein
MANLITNLFRYIFGNNIIDLIYDTAVYIKYKSREYFDFNFDFEFSYRYNLTPQEYITNTDLEELIRVLILEDSTFTVIEYTRHGVIIQVNEDNYDYYSSYVVRKRLTKDEQEYLKLKLEPYSA